jgi:hypothetical protein
MIKQYLISKYPDAKANCDDVNLPFYNYEQWYLSRFSFPFIYGVDRDGNDFVLLGGRCGTHSEIISDFYTELHCMGCGERNKLFCGRVFENNSSNGNVPKGFLTVWVSDTPEEYTSSKRMKRIYELLKKQNVDILNYSIFVEEENNIMLEEKRERALYEISVKDYIALNIRSLSYLPLAYERQERCSNSKYNRPEWEQFDDGSGNNYLGWHLLTRQDESRNMKKNLIRINENLINEIVKKSVKRILKEIYENGNGNDITEQLVSTIKQIFKTTNLKYRMAEYTPAFKMAIENGASQDVLINAFKTCGLDCTTNPRSKTRFDEIWGSLSNG